MNCIQYLVGRYVTSLALAAREVELNLDSFVHIAAPAASRSTTNDVVTATPDVAYGYLHQLFIEQYPPESSLM